MTRNQFLNLLLLFSLLIVVMFFRTDDGTDKDQHLMPEMVRQQLTAVRSVHVGDVDMVYAEGGWKVTSSGGYPADGAVINRLLRGLGEALRREKKTDRPEGLARLGLGNGEQTVLRLKDGDGKVLYILEVGHQEPRGDYGGIRTFVAQGGQAWAISHLPQINRDPVSWMDPLLWRLNTARVQSLDVKDPGKRTFTFERDLSDASFKLRRNNKKLSEKADYLFGAPHFMALRGVEQSDGASLSLRRTLTWRTWDGLEVSVDIRADEADRLWAFFVAREIEVKADKVEGLDETVMAEVETLNKRWNGFAFRLDDEKMTDLMVPKAELTVAN